MQQDRSNILVIEANQLAAKYPGAYGYARASALFDAVGTARADKVYAQWACQNILDYRFPQE